MKFLNFFVVLIVAGVVGALLSLIFNELNFVSDGVQPDGILRAATTHAEGMGFYGNFQFAIWKLWPILIPLVIIVAGIVAFRGKSGGGGEGRQY